MNLDAAQQISLGAENGNVGQPVEAERLLKLRNHPRVMLRVVGEEGTRDWMTQPDTPLAGIKTVIDGDELALPWYP